MNQANSIVSLLLQHYLHYTKPLGILPSPLYLGDSVDFDLQSLPSAEFFEVVPPISLNFEACSQDLGMLKPFSDFNLHSFKCKTMNILLLERKLRVLGFHVRIINFLSRQFLLVSTNALHVPISPQDLNLLPF